MISKNRENIKRVKKNLLRLSQEGFLQVNNNYN